ncbi:MAG: methionyl-tRNA formyltransferase [Verrucomicrobia bacterium]|nr:methionyl-tRNA formyltransferase [Verrucomicrobiota bacterium]
MRVVYMATGDIAIPTLHRLLAFPGLTLTAIYTQPDRPFGRKLELHPPEIKRHAEAAGIPVCQPEHLADPEALDQLRGFRPDLIIVMAYGQILRRAVLRLPPLGCINLHASLLPLHRGASPIQAAIRAGDSQTGITVMHVAPALDSGDIILTKSIPILPGETGGSLHDRLAALAPEALAAALPGLIDGTAPRTPQDGSRATWLGKLQREDGALDWSLPAAEIERWIRAFDPWPGTFCSWQGHKLKIFPPVTIARGQGCPGEILEASGDRLVVACGSDALALDELQIEGRKRLGVRAFLAGQHDALRTGLQFH